LGHVFDVSQEVLDNNFFSFDSANATLAVNELAHQVAVLVNLFYSEECLCRKSDLFFFLDIKDRKDWVGVIASQNFIDLNVILSDFGACTVPS
jgi:hypothetical protein